jgi:hypothetical protein
VSSKARYLTPAGTFQADYSPGQKTQNQPENHVKFSNEHGITTLNGKSQNFY